MLVATDYTAMSKYIVSDVPSSSPGKCSNCGASKHDGRKYISFGLDVDGYGTVHICGSCVGDMAHVLDLFKELKNRLDAEELKNRNYEQLKTESVTLHERVVAAMAELETYYANLHSVRDNPVSNSTDSSDDSSDNKVESSAILSSRTESGPSQTKQRVIKQTPESGRKNVSNSTNIIDV